MRPRSLIGVWAIAVACGGTREPPAGTRAVVRSIVAPPVDADDVVVATVNGRPVWGSCITAQAARASAPAAELPRAPAPELPIAPRTDRQRALDECVAFELLAQAAEARGLADDPEVVEAVQVALVSQLVATFEDRHADPASLGDKLTAVLDRNTARLTRPAARASAYARVEVPTGATAEQDARARTVAERIAATLADQPGLMGSHLFEVAQAIDPTIRTELVKPMPASLLEAAYGDALFAIPEVGRSSRPVRTTWGWDVIVFTADEPARERSRDELARDIFPDLRRQVFQVWVNQIVKDRRVQIAIDDRQLEQVAP